MTYPLISVIVPCYNVEKFLPNCFKVFDRQTYKNLHVIFVNDGSSDGTFGLLNEYCAHHPQYTLITGENEGVASARNKGLNAIKGELFAFCDADDIISDFHFERLYKNISENAADMAVCSIKRISERRADKFNAGKRVKGGKVRAYGKTQALEQFFSQEKFDYLLMNKLFRTEILRKSGATFLDNCRYGEEGYFFFKYLSCAEKTVYEPCETYIYVQNQNSLMHSAFNESRLDIYKNLNAVMKEIAASGEFESVFPYVQVMRAGYSVGILFFILISGYKNGKVIAEITRMLNDDVKSLKKCPKVAAYKKAFLPLCAALAKMIFAKHLKKEKALTTN